LNESYIGDGHGGYGYFCSGHARSASPSSSIFSSGGSKPTARGSSSSSKETTSILLSFKDSLDALISSYVDLWTTTQLPAAAAAAAAFGYGFQQHRSFIQEFGADRKLFSSNEDIENEIFLLVFF